MPFKLKERIIKALTDSSVDLWFPYLTYDLAQTGWHRIKEEMDLDESDYGTARVILRDAGAARNTIYTLLFKNLEDVVRDTISVEALPESISDYYKKSGVDFYELELLLAQDSDKNEIMNCLSLSFDIIKQVPNLFTTVVNLVRCIHLIKPEFDDYDVSFSEPHIPFSIFVSVPQKSNIFYALRVAEAIIHEAMHLQLTLIEGIVPMISCDNEKFYSPWKEELRSPQGILHALYVFQVLKSFFSALLNSELFSVNENSYLKERCNLIVHQIAEVKDFSNHPYLTDLGREFTCELINTTESYKYAE